MEMHAGSLCCLILVVCAQAFGRGSYRWKEQFDDSWDDSKLEKPWQDEYPYDWLGDGEKQEVNIYETYRPAYKEPPPMYSRLPERPRRTFRMYEYETAIPEFDDDSTMWYHDDDWDSMVALKKSRTGRSNALVGQMLSSERLVNNDDWFEKPSGGSQETMAEGSSADSFQPYFDVLRNDKQPSLFAEVKAFLGPRAFRKRKLTRSSLKEDGTKLDSEKPAVEIGRIDDSGVNEKEQTTKQLIDVQDERKSDVENHEEKVTEKQMEQQKEPKENEIDAKDTEEAVTAPSNRLMDEKQKEDVAGPQETATEVELQPTTVGGHEQEGAIKEDQEEAKPVQTDEAHDGESVTQDGDSSDGGADSRHVTVSQTSPPQLPDEGCLKRVERQEIGTPSPAKTDGCDVGGMEQQTTKQLANPQDEQQPDDVEKEKQVEQREEDIDTKTTEEAASAPSSHLTDEEQKEAVIELEKKITGDELQPTAVESDKQGVSIKEDQEEAKVAQEGIHQEQSKGSESIRGGDSSAEPRGPEEKPGHVDSLYPTASKASIRKIRQIAPPQFLDEGSSKPVEVQQMHTSFPATEPTVKMGKINDNDVEHAEQLKEQLPDFQNEQKPDVQDVEKGEMQEEAKGEKFDAKTTEEAASAPLSHLTDEEQKEAVIEPEKKTTGDELQPTAVESDKQGVSIKEDQEEAKVAQEGIHQEQSKGSELIRGGDPSAEPRGPEEKPGHVDSLCVNASKASIRKIRQIAPPQFLDERSSRPVEVQQIHTSFPPTEPAVKMGKINDSDVEHAEQLTTEQLPDFQNEQKPDVQDVEKEEEAKGEEFDAKTTEEAVNAPQSRLMEDKRIEAVSGPQERAMAVEHQSTALESDKRETSVQEDQKEPKMIQKRSDQQQPNTAYFMQSDDYSAGRDERNEKTGLLKQYDNEAVSRHVYVPQILLPRFPHNAYSKPVEEKQMDISLPARDDFDSKTTAKQDSRLFDFKEERLRRITMPPPQKLPEQKQQVTSPDHHPEPVLSPEVLNEKAAEAILSRGGSSFMEMKGKTWTDRSRYYKEDPILVTVGRRDKSPSHSVIEMDGKKWKYPIHGRFDEKTREGKSRVITDQSLELPRILANIDNPLIVGRSGHYARPVYMAAAGVMDTVSKTAEKPQLDDMGQVEERGEKTSRIPESSGDSRNIVGTKSTPGEQIQSSKSDPTKSRENKPERVETPFVPLWSQNEQKWIELADKMMKSKLDGSYDRRFRRAGGSRPQKIFTEV